MIPAGAEKLCKVPMRLETLTAPFCHASHVNKQVGQLAEICCLPAWQMNQELYGNAANIFTDEVLQLGSVIFLQYSSEAYAVAALIWNS